MGDFVQRSAGGNKLPALSVRKADAQRCGTAAAAIVGSAAAQPQQNAGIAPLYRVADKLAHAFATQLFVWETVVGERDADFDHVSTGGYDAILSLVSPNHPLYSRIMDYYDSIEYSVQSHAVCPSFMSRSSGGAKTIELAWDGSQYIAELTDTNRVLSQFTFSASETGFHFSVSGNTLTITTDTAPTGNVTISASRSASRCGVLV